MNGKDLLDAMNQLDDKILEETRKERNRHDKFSKRLAISAVVCFVGVAAIWMVTVLPFWQKEKIKTVENVQNQQQDLGKEYDGKRIGIYQNLYLSSCEEVITVKDIMDWHEAQTSYEKEFVRGYDELMYYMETIGEYMKERSVNINSNTERLYFSYYVLGESGELDYIFCCRGETPNTSYYSPILSSCWTGAEFDLQQGSKEELEKFLAQSEKEKIQVRKKMEELADNLKPTQYEYMYFNAEQKKISVFLSDLSVCEELESQGILCEESFISMDEKYKELFELWERRKELELVSLDVDHYRKQIHVVSLLDENTFWECYGEVRKDILFEQEIGAANGWSRNPFEYLGLPSTIYVDDLDEFMELVRIYDESRFAEGVIDECYYDDLRLALEKLKETYPDYTYLQLYYKVRKDCDYEWYLNFDEELEKFVDNLPAYRQELDFFSELEYGDPQRLELKGLLRCYKELNPRKTYQEIYEEHAELKAVEEDTYMANSQKLFYKLYGKYVAKEKLAEKYVRDAKIGKIRNFVIWGIGSIGIVFFTVVLLRKKHTRVSE